jgi:hypothetical protein
MMTIVWNRLGTSQLTIRYSNLDVELELRAPLGDRGLLTRISPTCIE